MSSAPIQFHKIWIEQCEATEGIRERFGLENALPTSCRHSWRKSGGSLQRGRSMNIWDAWSKRDFSLHQTPIWKWMIWMKPKRSPGRKTQCGVQRNSCASAVSGNSFNPERQ